MFIVSCALIAIRDESWPFEWSVTLNIGWDRTPDELTEGLENLQRVVWQTRARLYLFIFIFIDIDSNAVQRSIDSDTTGKSENSLKQGWILLME